MKAEDYVKGVLSTESVPARLEVDERAFFVLLDLFKYSVQIADLLKRRLYYSKPIPGDKFAEALVGVGESSDWLKQFHEFDPVAINARMSPEMLDAARAPTEGAPDFSKMSLDNVDIRLLHSALGIFTESGEMLEAICEQFVTGVLDKVNFAEELGDVDWYKQIGHAASGVPEEVVRRMNNQKLLDKRDGRYRKGAFTVADAINRDTLVERSLLDAANDSAPGADHKAA